MNSPTANLEDALRGMLQAGTAPAELRRRLREEARRRDSRQLRTWMFMAAACLLLMLSGLGLWRSEFLDPAPGLARQAFAEYTSVKRLDFTGEPPAQGENCCSRWSQRAVGYSAPLPSCIQSCCIQGGRACQLGRKPAAVYVLDANRAIYVFREPIRRQQGSPGRIVPLPNFGQARLWNEGGRGYLLLEGLPR